jgi:hypothetical protein
MRACAPDVAAAVSDDELATKVARLERRLRELEQAVGRLAHRVPPLAPVDRAWLADLLPAVVANIGDAAWALPHLAALALQRGNGDLASALARPGGFLSMGKALARSAGHSVDDFTLLRVGNSRDGVLWQVKQCDVRDDQPRAADCASDNVAGTLAVSASCASRTP